MSDITPDAANSAASSERRPIAYGYVRMSTLHQENSPEIQREELERYYQRIADRFEWGGIFADPATTAKIHFRNRDAGHELYMRLQKGDAILVHMPDRLCRRFSDALRLMEDWDEQNVVIHLTKWGIDTSMPMIGKMLFHMMGCFAEWENELRSERVRETMAYLKARNRPVNAHPGWGYKWEGTERVVCLRDRKLMGDIVDWREKGWDWRDIADHLHRHGVYHRRWSREQGRKGGNYRFKWIEWNQVALQRMYHVELQRRADDEISADEGRRRSVRRSKFDEALATLSGSHAVPTASPGPERPTDGSDLLPYPVRDSEGTSDL